MILKLTRVSKEFTEAGQKKFDKFMENREAHFNGESPKGPTDEYGNDAEFYKNLGVNPPEDLEDTESDIDLDLNDDDYNINYTKFLCNIDQIMYADEHEENRSMIAYGSQIGVDSVASVVFIVVKESTDEIHRLYEEQLKKYI